MTQSRLVAALIVVALLPWPALAEVQVSGLADFLGRNASEEDITNVNFRPSSNLDVTRVRLFLDASISNEAQFFTQLLISRYNDVFVYGAYLRFEELAGSPVNMHLGLLPTTVGTFAARTYSDKNPLVGVPLAYNHHSVLNPWVPQSSVADLIAARGDRSSAGLPVLYDNCWNTGVEAFGQAGQFDWSVALLTGSTSLPQRTQEDKLPQATGRFAWYRGPGLQVGVSGWAGPYLLRSHPATFAPGEDHNDFLNGGYGYDLYASLRYVEIHSEVYRTFWEHPELPTLYAMSGYLEAKYKFVPRWFAAARFGFFEPERVADGTGSERRWDYAVHRVEYGLGFKPMPRVTTKLVAQSNRFDGNASLDRDHYMLQVSAGF